jgi:hypothetical protein
MERAPSSPHASWPGFRTVAGPLAGAGGLPPLRFFIANLLGAVCYVPLPVLAGYGAGYGLGHWIEKLRGKLGLKEDLALFAVIVVVAGLVFPREAVEPDASSGLRRLVGAWSPLIVAGLLKLDRRRESVVEARRRTRRAGSATAP